MFFVLRSHTFRNGIENKRNRPALLRIVYILQTTELRGWGYPPPRFRWYGCMLRIKRVIIFSTLGKSPGMYVCTRRLCLRFFSCHAQYCTVLLTITKPFIWITTMTAWKSRGLQLYRGKDRRHYCSSIYPDGLGWLDRPRFFFVSSRTSVSLSSGLSPWRDPLTFVFHCDYYVVGPDW